MSSQEKEKLSMAAIEKTTTQIEQIIAEFSLDIIRDLPVMQKAVKLATGVAMMRASLTDELVHRLFMPLQGSPLGFRTDKDKDGGYPLAIVRECVIEAMMRGFYPVGNELNIIADRAYFTKEGFDRKVRELPGVTELEFFPGVPQVVGDKGALVPYRATWKLQGFAMKVVRDLVKRDDGSTTDERIPVRVNSGMGADGILGKARRKILVQIYEKCTGMRFDDADADAIETTGEVVSEKSGAPANKTQVDELVERHQAKAAAKSATKEPTQGALPVDPAAGSDGLPEPGASG